MGKSVKVAMLHVVGDGVRSAVFEGGNVGIGTRNPGGGTGDTILSIESAD